MNIELLSYKQLPDFPSGSGIEYYDGKFYLVGDDANSIYILDKNWQRSDEIILFEFAEKRVPKKIKNDLEATALLDINGIPYLFVAGSGSKLPHRDKAFLINLHSRAQEEIVLTTFYDRIKSVHPVKLNIEGAAAVKDYFILCNRGNKTEPDNHIIITRENFWKDQDKVPFNLIKPQLPILEGDLLGLSGITYSIVNDVLIFTASTEITDNPYDDGPIGDSYLALVENASEQIGKNEMLMKAIVNLSAVDKKFEKYKIESVCVEAEEKGKMDLSLISDNDCGSSFLFKVRMSSFA
jgi:hypothetical protein